MILPIWTLGIFACGFIVGAVFIGIMRDSTQEDLLKLIGDQSQLIDKMLYELGKVSK